MHPVFAACSAQVRPVQRLRRRREGTRAIAPITAICQTCKVPFSLFAICHPPCATCWDCWDCHRPAAARPFRPLQRPSLTAALFCRRPQLFWDVGRRSGSVVALRVQRRWLVGGSEAPSGLSPNGWFGSLFLTGAGAWFLVPAAVTPAAGLIQPQRAHDNIFSGATTITQSTQRFFSRRRPLRPPRAGRALAANKQASQQASKQAHTQGEGSRRMLTGRATRPTFLR